VTEADLRAEKIIIGCIKKNFPANGIVSEEAGRKRGGKEHWIADPLDGTHNYCFGIPFFAVCLGLVDREGIKNCVVFDPVRNEIFHAERGAGAFRNGKRLRVSGRDKISESVINIPSQNAFRRGINESFVERFAEIRAMGCGSLSMSYLAGGLIDAKIQICGYWYEFPSSLLVTEAGGKVTTWEGGSVTEHNGKVIASNGKLHEEMLGML
jgi:myo-inositol-1(or 4)-monophosphatase